MINAMRDAGIDPPDTLTDDGKIHRYAGPADKSTNKKNWYILYPIENGIQAGSFGRWVGDSNGAIKWCNKTATEFTPEEKAAYKKRKDDMRRRQAEERKQAAEDCAARCRDIWANAVPATDDHPYLVKKQVKAHGLKMMGDALLVPIKGIAPAELRGIQFIKPDGDKVFKTGVDYTGAVHLIGKPVDDTLIITEGYATGASIHEATGHAVLVAFVAGNLKAVAEATRSKRPNWTLIIAGDDDQWAKEFKADGSVIYHEVPCELNGGKRINTGRIKAGETAKSIRADLRFPVFSDISTHPTDFNDLANLEGAAVVKRQIFPPPMAEYEPPPDDGDYYEPPEVDPEQYTEHPLQNAPFQCLGYNHGEYFYLPKGAPQVKALTADRHSSSHLVSMAPLHWWEGTFPAKSGFDSNAAANMLYRTNEKIGVYDNRRIRGRGAWIEEPRDKPKRTVLHLGNRLIVDGKELLLAEHKSRWIYEAGSELELDGLKTDPMLNAESHKLLELCKRFSWEKPLSAELLAGWMVIAPLCGVMPWRPHILVTGPAGSGKSTISENVIRRTVGPAAICCIGNTTEAGLRGEAGSDARPVLFDEAESGGESSKRMQSVLELARQSSSDIGYSILKGSQSGKSVKYQPRMCFCFSSIGAAATQQADNDRITPLSLRKDESTGHEDRWKALKTDITNLLTDEYCIALRSRGYSLIPVILDNYRTFSRLLAVKHSSQRMGDQYGAMLAGSYSLRSRNIINDATAQAFIDSMDWGETIQDSSSRDEIQCLGVILQHQIRITPTEAITIGELLETASLHIDTHCEAARTTLLRSGIRVTEPGDGFFIANKHTALERILDKTPWSKNWGHILARVHGAHKTKPMNFTAGAYSRAVLLPMTVLNTGGE